MPKPKNNPRPRRVPKPTILTLPQAVERIRDLHHQGDLEGARTLAERVIERWPNSADAWNFAGMLRYQASLEQAAIQALRRSVELAPDYPDAHANLGNMLLQARRITEAQHHLRRALFLHPEAYAPRIALSALLRALSEYDEAEAVLRPALEQMPNVGHVHQTYANLLAVRGEYERALEHYRRAVELAPDIAQSQLRVGLALAYSGKVDKARELFQRQVDRDPSDVQARHMLASLGGSQTPDRAPDDYVKDLFDGFSESFDAKLAMLEYRAPELLAAMADDILGADGRGLHVLDAGCGTGLLAPLIRHRCRILEGVDLSPGMLAKARPRKLYDELIEAELTAFLQSRRATYDVVFSADTLCYFGALDAAAKAAFDALNPGGWLLFSVENNEDQEHGFAIQINGRYAHRQAYVRQCLEQAGFGLHELRHETLRFENQKPVAGLLVAAQKLFSAGASG